MPNTCLSFTLKGPYAHFKRVEGAVVRQTYKIPPRTTVAGIIAAILGYERNSYYETLGTENSDIAITPETEIKTLNIPANVLSTSHDTTKELTKGSRSISVQVPDPTQERQQYNFEVIHRPKYKIDVRIRDQQAYQQLKTALQNNTTQYPIALGLSEYLASIEYHGEHECNQLPTGTHKIDSTVPNANKVDMINTDCKIHTERSQADFTVDTPKGHRKKRKATGYNNVALNKNGKKLTTTDTTPTQINNRTVMFA